MRKRVSPMLALAAAAVMALPVGAVSPKLELAKQDQKSVDLRARNLQKGVPGLSSYRDAKAGESQFVQPKTFVGNAFAKSAPMNATATMPELAAQVVNNNGAPIGIYNLAPNGDLTPVFLNDNLAGLYGSAYDAVQGVYRVNTITYFWGIYLYGGNVAFFNVNQDGEFSYYRTDILPTYGTDYSYAALYGMVCDNETGRVYGIFNNNDAQKIYVGYLDDIYDMQATMLVPQEDGGSWVVKPWIAVGLYEDTKAKTKNLYGVDVDGVLYSVDIKEGSKTLGLQKRIGNTGIYSKYIPSGTIVDGVFYVSTCNDETSDIYAVDLATAKATKVLSWEGPVEIANLFQAPAQAKEKAPAVPTAGIANFKNGSLTGDITFTMPSTLYDGTAAKGQCEYEVTVYQGSDEDDNVIETREGEASYSSTLVTETFTLPQAGIYTFIVRAKNAGGLSPKLKIRAYVGTDTPSAPKNVELVYDYTKKQFQVSWDAVTEGAHAAMGSYFDAKKVKYNVALTPATTGANAQNLNVTSYKYNLVAPAELTKYFYTVEVVYDGVATGIVAESNVWMLGAEDAPVYINFYNGADDVFIFDSNNDGYTWVPAISSTTYEGILSVYESDDNAMDDWIVTPGIKLEAGNLYVFSSDISCRSPFYDERIEFRVAQTPEPAALAKGEQILEETQLTGFTFETFSGNFFCKKSGVYYFGVHDISPAGAWEMYVRNLKVSAPYNVNAPKAVTNLVAIPDENGGASAMISFNVPTQNVQGDAIKSVSYVEVYRNASLITEITKGLSAGNYVKFIDDNADLNAYNTYEIVPVLEVTNEDGTTNTYRGEVSDVTIFVGVEGVTPGSVENIEMSEEGNTGKIKLTWTAPTVSSYGYPLPSHVCKYRIYNSSFQLVKETNYDTEWTTDLGDDYQGFVYYYIQAYIVDENGVETGGSYTATSSIFVGKPYSYPLMETVENGTLKYEWAGTGWQIMDLAAQGLIADMKGADDNYYMTCYASGEGNDLFSGKIFIPADAKNPALSFFWYMYAEDFENELNVSVRANGGEYEMVESVVENTGEIGWNRTIVDLSEYKGQTIQIKFTANNVAYVVSMIDRIVIGDIFDKDIAGSYTSVPESTLSDEEFTITVGFFNDGKDNVPGGSYTIALYRNGEKVQTADGYAIAAGESYVCDFTDKVSVVDEKVEYYAVAEWDADENLGNNYTPIASINVEQRDLPTTELSGELNELGQPALSWIPAEAKAGSTEFSDGFENYKPWISVGDQEGDWETIDGDGANTGGLQYWPTLELPNDYFVVDVNEAFGDSSYAHSGNKVIISALDGYEYTDRDDWLISKELNPDGVYELSFWTRGFNEAYSDEFEVLVSDNTNDRSDFRLLMYVPDVPLAWNEFKFLLPEGTKYFAIRCTSPANRGGKKGGLLIIDDLELKGLKLDLKGYNLYRNGMLLNESPLGDVNYVDTAAKERECSYVVSVVWDRGESAPSNDVELQVTQTGIAGLEEALANVAVDGRNIIISDAEGQKVAIYTADGKAIYNAGGTAKTVIAVEPAVYVVKVGDKAARVIVR